MRHHFYLRVPGARGVTETRSHVTYPTAADALKIGTSMGERLRRLPNGPSMVEVQVRDTDGGYQTQTHLLDGKGAR